MQNHGCTVCALYPTEQAARLAVVRLREYGLPENRIFLIGDIASLAEGGDPGGIASTGNDLDDIGVSSIEQMAGIVRDDVLGAGIGAASGAADVAVAESRDVRLFMAEPVFRSLSAIRKDIGNSMGAADASPKVMELTEIEFVDMVRLAVGEDHWAVVAQCAGDREADDTLALMRRLFG